MSTPAGHAERGDMLVPEIEYDASTMRRQFHEFLDEMGAVLLSDSLESLLGRDVVHSARSAAREVKRRLDGVFTLVVLGEFKRGKSTLINAIARASILPTDVTPETMTINELCHGEELIVRANTVDGGSVRLQPEDLKRERLKVFLGRLGKEVNHLSIQASVQGLSGLKIVDTPGTGDLFSGFDAQVHDYLAKADAIIYVVSAMAPLSQSDMTFLRLSVAPHDFPKIMFVVNMSDAIKDQGDLERLVGRVKAKVHVDFPGAEVIALSALDELALCIGGPRPASENADGLSASFAHFRGHLDRSVFMNRDVLQLARAVSQSQRLLQGLEQNAARLRSAMNKDTEGLARQLDWLEEGESSLNKGVMEHKEQLLAQGDELSQRACKWMGEFFDRFENDVVPTLSAFSYEDLRRHFHFFLSDRLHASVEQCLMASSTELLDFAGEIRAELGREMASQGHLDQTQAQIASFGEISFRATDSSFVVLDSLTPLGGLVRVLAGAAKELEEEKNVSEYLKKVRDALPALRSSVIQEMRRLHAEMAAEVATRLNSAFELERQAAMAAIQQAQALKAQGENRLQEVSEQLAEFMSTTTLLHEELGSVEERLTVVLEQTA